MSDQHRPLLTRHGTHCICGVFCASGRNIEAWRDHVADRTTLDGILFGVNSSPIGEHWWHMMQAMGKIVQAYSNAGRRIAQALEGVQQR